jgi:hypothetical protein
MTKSNQTLQERSTEDYKIILECGMIGDLNIFCTSPSSSITDNLIKIKYSTCWKAHGVILMVRESICETAANHFSCSFGSLQTLKLVS